MELVFMSETGGYKETLHCQLPIAIGHDDWNHGYAKYSPEYRKVHERNPPRLNSSLKTREWTNDYIFQDYSTLFQNMSGATLLHEAVKSDKRMKICTLLLNNNADPNAEDENGRTPMHYNSIHAYGTEAEICKKLLSKGGDPCKPDKNKNTPLHDAARNGRSDIFKAYLDSKGYLDPNLANKQERTPLHEASKNGHHVICTLLLGAGADPNLQDNDGNTPLHLACMGVVFDGNIPKCLKILVEKGANLALKNSKNQTALDILPKDHHSNAWYAWEDYVEQAHQRSMYSERLRETVPIDTVKLFICGDACAGKTSLKKSLVYDKLHRKRSKSKPLETLEEIGSSFDSFVVHLVHGKGTPRQESEDHLDEATVGIDIEKHLIQFGGNFSIWDCAGHIEYHVTHGMFLGVRNAIFLVPYDLTHSREKQTATISYWLSFIKCAHDYSDKKPKVVLVGTHLDQLQLKEDSINWTQQNLQDAKGKFDNRLEILDKVISLNATDGSGNNQAMTDLRMDLGTLANKIKASTNVPKLIHEITKKDRLEAWRQDNKVLPVKVFIQKVQDLLPYQPREDIQLAIPYMQDMGEIYAAKFAANDKKQPEVKIVLDTKWLSKDIIAPALARPSGNYRDTKIQCLPRKVYYSREELMGIFKETDKCDGAIRFLEHLRLLFRVPAPDNENAAGDKFMIPARLDDKDEAGLLSTEWTAERRAFTEYYGRCIKCKEDADMIVPSVFPYLQHYILDTICEGKEERYKISSSFLRFVTTGGIQGMVQLVKDKKAIVVAVRGENTQNPTDDRHGCYRTLQIVLAQINAVLLQYSRGSDVDTFFLSSQSLQEQTELEDAYKYGLQELLQAEQLPDESRASATNGSKPAKIGRVFRQSKSEEVTNILIQGFDLRCIKYYGMECRVEWLPEDMNRYLRILDIEDDKMCEDYRSVANMLGISTARVGVISRDLPPGQSVTLALLNEWREQKCRPCVTIGMLHTLLLFMGLVDTERSEILKQLQKVLDEHGQTGPFGIHPTAEELYLSIEERSRKVTLKKNWKRLTNDIMAMNLVDRLDDLIPNEKREKIRSAESHSLAAQLLLESLLLCKGTGWFDEFMQALKDNNYNVLAQYLMLQCEEEREASSEYMSNYDHLNPGDMEVFGEPIHRTQSSSVRRIRFYHGQFKGFTHAAGKTTLTPLTQEELKVVRKLDQSNIVRFLGYMENDFSYTIVSELCDKSLRDRLKRSQEEPSQSLLRKWMKEVTSAVRYLHGGVVGIRSDDVHPIVHGRINTMKCLLLGDVLKLSGAGVSRHKADHRDRRIIDAFMAPEVHDPAIGFTPACDIYALGVLFWEMFTQQIPEARSDTLGQTISGNDAFPQEVRNVMPLCWKRDCKERATIGDIIARLFQ